MSSNQEISRKLSILIRLATADKHFADQEKAMIIRVGLRNGLSEESISRLIRYPISIEKPEMLSLEKKSDYLLDCMDLMYADDKIMESELIFVRGIALKLGFSKGIVDLLAANHKITGDRRTNNPLFGQNLA
jgi:uncharacterized tellurite resistance protein B-like protein